MERIQRRFRGPVRAEIGVGPGEVLSIIDGEVHVVQSMMRGAVDEFLRPMTRNHVAVVNQDGPDLNRNEEDQVQISLHGENEDEDALEGFRMVIEDRRNEEEEWGYSLVWQRLHISIQRVERQRSPWRGNCDPWMSISIGTCQYTSFVKN